MSNFQSAGNITLQPNDANATYSFSFPVCSTSTANDGYLPADTTISGVVVTAQSDDGTDATADMIDTTTNTTTVVSVTLDYPTTTMSGITGVGYYKLTFVLTLDNGTVLEADFNRVEAKNL